MVKSAKNTTAVSAVVAGVAQSAGDAATPLTGTEAGATSTLPTASDTPAGAPIAAAPGVAPAPGDQANDELADQGGALYQRSNDSAQLLAGGASGDDRVNTDLAADVQLGDALQAAATRTVFGVEISAMRDGFRRAGRAWYREPTFIQEGDLDEDQIAALLAEPNIRMVGARREVPVEGDEQ